MRITKITQDKKQTRSTIPKQYVDEFKVTNKDSMYWDKKKGKLVAELVKEKKQ